MVDESEFLDLPIPDRSLHKVGRGDFITGGQRQLRLLIRCGLTPDARVLEIGCGIGRLAYALASYLGRGTYTGFDVSTPAVLWLNEHYASRLTNFSFDVLDVYNPRYNASGTTAGGFIRWPYDDESFDFGCAISVFTHQRLPEVGHYLEELRRVLRPGGRAVTTFLLVDARDPSPPVRDGKVLMQIDDVTFTRNRKVPERGVAFRADAVHTAIARSGLTIVDAVEGTWHGRSADGPRIGQDVLVLQRGD